MRHLNVLASLLLYCEILPYKTTDALNITSTSAVPTNGGQLTIVGVSFSHPLSVFLNSQEVTVSSFNSTSIEILVPAGTGKDHLVTVFSGAVECGEAFNSSWSYPFSFLT